MRTLLPILLVLAAAAGLSAGPLDGLAPAPVVYIEPVMLEGGDFQVEEEGSETLLVFREVEKPSGIAAEVQAALEKAPAFQAARRLYGVARDVARKMKCVERGPVAIHIYAGSAFGDLGPGYSGRRIKLKNEKGGLTDLPGFMLLSDVATGTGRLTIPDLIREGYLALVIAHELGHQMMADLYGAGRDPVERSLSRNGHDVMMITDPHLALNEGWAEALEAVTGDLLAAGKQAGWGESAKDPAIRAMFRGRQDILKADRYIWDHAGRKDGDTRNGLQMLSSEGVVAYQIYQLVTHRDFAGGDPVEGFRRVAAVLARHRPQEIGALMDAVARDFPAQRKLAAQLLGDWTKWVPFSPESAELYRAYWEANIAFKRHQRDDETGKELGQERQDASLAYTRHREQVLAKVLAAGSIAPPVADPLWLDSGDQRIGLNLAPLEQLSRFLGQATGRTSESLVVAQKIVAHRDSSKGGYFRDVDSLAPLLDGQSLDALRAARQAFTFAAQAGQQPAPMAAYLRSHRDRILSGRLLRWKAEGPGAN